MVRYFKLKLIVYCFLCIFIALLQNIWAFEQGLPFYPGEELHFNINWGIIRAGNVTLKVLSPEEIDGERALHFEMITQTSQFIDLFHKLREKIDSYTTLDMKRSVLYKKQNTGKHKKDIVVEFNWKDRIAQYSNFNEKREPIKIKEGSLDPLAIFYYSRMVNFKPNTTINVPVTDGKKCFIGKANIIKKEHIKVKKTIYHTYLIEPDISNLGGAFKKFSKAKLQLWVTDDDKRLPVKIICNTSIGKIWADLVYYKKGYPDQLKYAYQREANNLIEQ